MSVPGSGGEAEPAPSRPGVCSGALAGGRHPQGVERPGGPPKLPTQEGIPTLGLCPIVSYNIHGMAMGMVCLCQCVSVLIQWCVLY